VTQHEVQTNVTEQERSLAISATPCPHAGRKPQ